MLQWCGAVSVFVVCSVQPTQIHKPTRKLQNPNSKKKQLANVYFAFELQRRLGAKGLQACAADPGAVRTNIYNNSPKLSKGIVNVMINKFYAPPEVRFWMGGSACKAAYTWAMRAPSAGRRALSTHQLGKKNLASKHIRTH